MTRPRSFNFASRLFRWFAKHKRDLPWREEPRDPYRVWLSEVMLQQTQVATVIPYYERWLKRFPTLKNFADAPLDDVLKLWEGLGYYLRARNFHSAAQIVMHEYDGQIPRTVEQLMELPGIGRYTAGAIASLAFNEDAPLLDGNVKRVLSRVFALSSPSNDELWQLCESLLPRGKAGAFNEALMELGATVCTPRSPNCLACPLNSVCKAYAQGNPDAYPAKAMKKEAPRYDVVTAVIVDEQGRVLMGQRPPDGLLGGLWEFVSSEFRVSSSELNGSRRKATGKLKRMITNRAGLIVNTDDVQLLGTVKHGFTHFKITRHVWLIHVGTNAERPRNPSIPIPKLDSSRGIRDEVERSRSSLQPGGYNQLKWVPFDQVRQLALTRSDQKILHLYETHRSSLFA